MQLQIAVTGAAGDQGSAIARALATAGHQVTGFTRQPSRTARIEAVGAQARVVPPELPLDALQGFDTLIFSATTDYRPGARQAQAHQAAQAAVAAKVKHIVYNAAADANDHLQRPVAQTLRDLQHILEDTGIPVTALYPTVYMDNLAQPWCQDAIHRDGVLAYPMTPQVRVSWLSHQSLGEFTRDAVEHFQGASRTFRIGGPEALTLSEIAAILGAKLGKVIKPVAVPLDQFAATLNANFGAPAGDDIADFYRFVEQYPDTLARSPEQWAPLPTRPESFVEWLARGF
jgi:uncharacterized protein YbjT (DUF2867 family)